MQDDDGEVAGLLVAGRGALATGVRRMDLLKRAFDIEERPEALEATHTIRLSWPMPAYGPAAPGTGEATR